MVGIGPGNLDQLTTRARQAITEAEVVIGYQTYLELIRELLNQQVVVSSGMRREVERCRQAVELAQSGKKVTLVSSGDPGVYGMAGILLETIGPESPVEVEVIPGVTAASAAAAVLGAPLMNDFAIISLSDLLTPWETVRRRVAAAAAGDFVLVLYNPKSHKRVSQIEEVREILLEHRSPSTPVGIVRNARRAGEEIQLATVEDFTGYPIDMFTVVVIGNSTTYITAGKMITPRGYQL